MLRKARGLTISLMAILTVLLATTTPSMAQQRLVIASWGGAWGEMADEYIIEPFKAAHGVDVVVQHSGASSDILAKVRAQRNRPQIDLITMPEPLSAQAAAEGLLEPLPYDQISNYADLWDQAKMEPYGPAILFAEVGIAYNPEMVDTPPTSWADLWKPEYRDKIALPRFGNTSAFSTIVMAAYLTGGNEHNIGDGWKKLEELAPNVRTVYEGDADIAALFERREVAIAVWYNGPAYALKDKGFPLEYVRPAEGVPGVRSMINVVKGAPNRDLAIKMVDQYLSVSAQKAMAERVFYGPVNKKVVLDEELAQKVPYGEDAMAGFLVFDWHAINQQIPAWQEQWMKIFGR